MPDPMLHRYTNRAMGATPEPGDGVETDNVEDLGGWGLLRGHRDRAVSLELRRKDDTVLAIPYAFVEQFLYVPADGITLRVAGREVRIRGRGLNEGTQARPLTLFTALCRHRVSWVAERGRANGPASAEGAVIESLHW